ncbi:hypothetical protein ACIBL6_32740 [Streptomyces sp. NPDC050400]|uniref:hypothetical protein n=1 Tax=Streptomyces sp. NPDC050400 TaxID=3365610 RepID=UPI0037B2B67F
MNDRLLATVATAMAQLITSIDMTDDDEVDPDLATRWLEDVAATFGRLSSSDRLRLAQFFRDAAEHESRAAVRASMMELPNDLGLEDEGED